MCVACAQPVLRICLIYLNLPVMPPMPPAPANNRIVLSASRRTDIPAFYMNWFMAQLQRGAFDVVNPYNRKVRRVPADTGHVHSVVFWSKNFGPFLRKQYGQKMIEAGYHLFFNFTLNSQDRRLEPHVPPLNKRLEQMTALSRLFGPERIFWRFDPLCRYRTGGGAVVDNRTDFETIARHAAACGIRTCITSFMDRYAKIDKRVQALADLEWMDFTPRERQAIVLRMEKVLAPHKIGLALCCEKVLVDALGPHSTVKSAACIDNARLIRLSGTGDISTGRDTGQRVKAGCGCRISVDIGSYHLHPCYHDCLFCYANPASPATKPGPACNGRPAMSAPKWKSAK